MKTRFLLPILLPMLLLATVISRAQINYYVSSVEGNDTNLGTPELPFRTVGRCVGTWNDTVQVNCHCSGVFNEEVIIRKGGISPLQRNGLVAWDTDNDGIRSDETFVLDGEGTRNIAIDVAIGARPDNVEIGWVEFRNYQPDGGCGGSGGAHFIRMNCYGSDGCADWLVHDNTFGNLAQFCNVAAGQVAIQPANAPNLLVESNRFDSIGGFIMGNIQGAGIRFRNNIVGVVGTGISASSATIDGMEISGNLFNCDGNGVNAPGSSATGPQSAINFSDNIQGSVIRNNTFNDCVTCIYFGTTPETGERDNSNHVVEGNIIRRSERVTNRYVAPIVIKDKGGVAIKNGAAIKVRDLTFRNNVILNTSNPTSWVQGAAVDITSGHPYPCSNNITFANNTVHGFLWGVRVDEALIGTTPYANQTNGVTLVNNIFSGIRDAQFTLNTSGVWIGPPPANWVSNHNTFSTVDKFAWGRARTLAAWQALAGNDSNSTLCSPSYEIDGRGVFRLLHTDVCATDRGATLPGFAADIDGDPRPNGAAWDIGADEFNGAKNYYVASWGSDLNPGTPQAPLRTIQKCVDKWNNSDWIRCRCAGVFNEEVVVRAGGPAPDRRNQIIAWDTDADGNLADEQFVIDGQGERNIAIEAAFPQRPDYVEIAWATLQNFEPDTCGHDTPSLFIKLKCSGLNGCSDWWIHNNTFKNLRRLCDAGSASIAIQPSYTPNLLVEQNIFDSVGGFIMRYVDGPNIRFRDNVVNIKATGLKAWDKYLSNFQVTGNVFNCDGNGYNNPNTPGCGLQTAVNISDNGQGVLIGNNIFNDCVTAINLGTDTRYGHRDVTNVVIENNRMHRGDAVCHLYTPMIKVEDISSYSTTSRDSMEVRNVIMRNNIIAYHGTPSKQLGAAIDLAAGHDHDFTSNFTITGNTIQGYYYGIKFTEAKKSVTVPYPYQINGVVLKNNILTGVRDAQLTMSTNGAWIGTGPRGVVSDYNTFSTINRFRWGGGNRTIAEWRSLTGNDNHSMVGSPQLYVGGDGIYRLHPADTVARDKGTIISELSSDIDGDARPYGAGVDIAADEESGHVAVPKFMPPASGNPITIQWHVYPNPAANFLTIETEEMEEGELSVELLTVTMEQVLTGFNGKVASGKQRFDLDVSMVPAGNYIVAVRTASGWGYQRATIIR
ncbi:MAG: hypothetical protein DYG96_02960 [Chlorobi bacterium CHB2]|nr:hypothetical protein [Chlorobi bacterium CHB2]